MSHPVAHEVNFDGLIGPSHSFGGMADGNIASAHNEGHVSNPRQAALQGVRKMRQLLNAGLIQGVLPPLPRPNFDFLVAAGFHGTDQQIISAAATQAPGLLKAAYSASPMWAANAATISPSADTADGRVHITPANLSSMLHRSHEHSDTTALLCSIFENENHFAVHAALPSHQDFSDEGAANHIRLCKQHGTAGLEIFIYGREPGELHNHGFPARQSRLASDRIISAHQLQPDRSLLWQQSKRAIDAGAFHNDVVCVGHLDTLFFHENAFDDPGRFLAQIRQQSEDLFELHTIMVSETDVPLDDAVKSYLFNSQIVQTPDRERFVLIAPKDTQAIETTNNFCKELVKGNGPIEHVEFVDVRESMRNGGGPACLRLRVVLTSAELEAAHSGVILDNDKLDRLEQAITEHYRDRVEISDFADIAFANECRAARESILDIVSLGGLA